MQKFQNGGNSSQWFPHEGPSETDKAEILDLVWQWLYSQPQPIKFMQKFQNGGNSSSFFFLSKNFRHFCMNFIGWGSGHSYCCTKYKTFFFNLFQMVLHREIICACDPPTFRRVVFAWLFRIQTLCKINKHIFLVYFKIFFIKPNKFYINIYISNL